MTERTIDARQGFGRLFVLGGFTLVKGTRPSIATNDVNKRAVRQPRLVGVRYVPDVSKKAPHLVTGSRGEEDDRAAIERGEDEGMFVLPY